jgi:hypothetical protein
MNSVDQEPNDFRRTGLLAAGGLALVVFATYADCLTQTFGFSDDFWLLWEWRQDPRAVTGVWNAAGRWMTAVWCHLAWYGADSLDDLWRPRFGGLLGIYGLALGLAWSLRRMGCSPTLSFTGAALAVLLPTFQVFAAWATCAGHVYGCLLSLASFWLIERGNRSSLTTRRALLTAAALLQLLAFTIYQPAAMFAVPLLAMWVISRTAEWTREHTLSVVRHLGVLGVCMAIYLALFRLQSQAPAAVDLSERAATSTNYLLKLGRFVLQPVAQSCVPFGFTKGWPNGLLLLIVFAVLGGLIPLGLWQRLVGSRRQRALQIGFVYLLIPLAYAPNLFVASDFFPYRTRPAIAVLILLLLLAAGGGWLRLLMQDQQLRRRLCILAAAATIVMATLLGRQHLQTYFIVPFRTEWNLLCREVERAVDAGPVRPLRVVFLRPPPEPSFAPQVIYDEFGRRNASIEWVNEGMVGLALRQALPPSLAIFKQAEFFSVPCTERTDAEMENDWLIDARFVASSATTQ